MRFSRTFSFLFLRATTLSSVDVVSLTCVTAVMPLSMIRGFFTTVSSYRGEDFSVISEGVMEFWTLFWWSKVEAEHFPLKLITLGANG